MRVHQMKPPPYITQWSVGYHFEALTEPSLIICFTQSGTIIYKTNITVY